MALRFLGTTEVYSGKIFAAFDTETTGLHAATDHLMEIGAVKFNRDGIIGEPFSSLIKPPVPLTPFLQNLTHITPEMLENQSDAATVTFEFLRWLSSDDVILIAHNAPFDMYFINAQLERMKQEAAAAGGVVEDVEYGAGVTLKVLVPEEKSEEFASRIFDQTAGSVRVCVTGESFRAVPVR